MSYYVIDVIMTLRDVVGWLVRGFRKKGAVRLGRFLLGPPGAWHVNRAWRDGIKRLFDLIDNQRVINDGNRQSNI